MTRTNGKTASSESNTEQLPNRITVVGRGVPSNFEFSVAGDIEMMSEDPVEEATVVTKNAVEGSIEVGVQRFRFSGELANIHVADWNGMEGGESPSTPTIHVDYGVSDR
ncbi:hypothetical protein ACFR99_13600 [Haloarchaeobius amylolyticus]|uniref:Uncharacterized protein n=1 Tax=Haloarchaeobius amylolyticus TaxID=1198296 RepID=A0ABD6BIQ4_9EURY